MRHPWIATAVQGWRHEIALSIATFLVLFIAWLIAPWGPYFVLLCAGIVIWQRPDLRSRFQSRALREVPEPLLLVSSNSMEVGR